MADLTPRRDALPRMTWEELPDALRRRWEPLRPLVEACLARGMTVSVQPGDEVRVDDANPAIWSGPAFYYPPRRVLAMTEAIATGRHAGYATYRGDLHELGHAVWYLLLTPQERWQGYFPLWDAARAAGRLLDAYSAERPEEGWAQDFEAWWTASGGAVPADHARDDLLRTDPERAAFVAGVMRRLGAEGAPV
ncbi:MAG: hypothetical protein QN157_06010 [Armatimonadota bacterium]|nr:hypothetical protein [Armatimonadota bacterium]